MKKIQRSFFRFYSPGLFAADSWDQEISAALRPDQVVWPERAYCFVHYVRTDVEADGTTYKGEMERVGPVYYHPDSAVRTLEDIQMTEGNSILVQNMKTNGWNKVVFTRWGNWPQPFEEGKDCILPKY